MNKNSHKNKNNSRIRINNKERTRSTKIIQKNKRNQPKNKKKNIFVIKKQKQ